MGSISQVASREPNPALNPAPFSRWTLRDRAAQRRLALRLCAYLAPVAADQRPIRGLLRLRPFRAAAAAVGHAPSGFRLAQPQQRQAGGVPPAVAAFRAFNGVPHFQAQRAALVGHASAHGAHRNGA